MLKKQWISPNQSIKKWWVWLYMIPPIVCEIQTTSGGGLKGFELSFEMKKKRDKNHNKMDDFPSTSLGLPVLI
jgi:hypothetical protein